MDAEGYTRIIDRKKDMILVSGFNVFPNEIENVISHLPGVLECAAVSIPDEKSGEAVKVLNNCAATPARRKRRGTLLPREPHRLQTAQILSSSAKTCPRPTWAKITGRRVKDSLSACAAPSCSAAPEGDTASAAGGPCAVAGLGRAHGKPPRAVQIFIGSLYDAPSIGPSPEITV